MAIAGGWLFLAARAGATVLTFESGVGAGSAIPQEYGDRVIADIDPPFWYGSAFGFTPNVVVHNNLLAWESGFGSLTAVGHVPERTGMGMITLVADTGYTVRLHSLDLAGWFQSDYTINALEVWSDDALVWGQRDVLVRGTLASEADLGFSTLAFDVPVTGSAITIVVDSANLGRSADNVAIDNVAFSQTTLGVNIPEPTTPLALISLSGLGMLRLRPTRTPFHT
jgi:hypothetical protein